MLHAVPLLLLGLTWPGSEAPAATASCLAAPSWVDSWLARHQNEDGSWDADGFQRHSREDDPPATPGQADADLRVTSLVVLQLLQNSDLTSGPNRRALKRSLDWFLSLREDALDLGSQGPRSIRDHALATLALTEMLSLSENEELRSVAGEWVMALEFARHGNGGWGAGPDLPADSLTTGWALIALRKAQLTQLPVSHRAMRDGWSFQRSCFDLESGLVAAAPEASPGRLAATGLTLAAANLREGDAPLDPWLRRAQAALHARGLEGVTVDGATDWESVFSVGLAAYITGGRWWKAWMDETKAMFHDLLEAQGQAPVSEHEPGGSLGSRAWSAMGVMLYYRYGRLIFR